MSDFYYYDDEEEKEERKNASDNPFGVAPVDPLVYKDQGNDIPELRISANKVYTSVGPQASIKRRPKQLKDSERAYPTWTPGGIVSEEDEEEKGKNYSQKIFKKIAIILAVVFPLALLFFFAYFFLKGIL